MFYAVGRLDLQIPGSQSLKEKRSVIGALKARLAQRLHRAVAEVDHQDLLQRSALGVAFVVSGPAAGANALEAARREVEQDPRAWVIDFATHVAALGDESSQWSWEDDEENG